MVRLRRAVALIAVVAFGAVLGACDPEPSDASRAPSERVRGSTPDAVTTTASDTVATPTTPYVVPSLGLTFALPVSYDEQDDPYYVFSALSQRPRSFISIMGDGPEVINGRARPGETLKPVTIDGLDAVIAKNSPVQGLPRGVIAYELLVANGSRSFSLIMSAEEASIESLWTVFIESVRIEPA